MGDLLKTLRRQVYLPDVLVWVSILGFGVLQFVCYEHAPDFPSDPTYYELARSLVERHSYTFDLHPETMLPPGFPLILAAIWITIGHGYAIFMRSMAVSTTLGLLATYEFVRREESRRVAAASCLLIAASPLLFEFSTQTLFSDMPYFFTSFATLLLATRACEAGSLLKRWALIVPACVLMAASLLIRSAAITLLLGMMVWMMATFLFDRRLALVRLKTLLPVILAGVAAQGIWSNWSSRHAFQEWPLAGYPGSYLSQLVLKDGNEPELGRATLGDFALRVEENLANRITWLEKVVTGYSGWISPNFASPLVLLPVALLIVGLWWSLLNNGPGGHFCEWYFLAHEALYLLWPWDFELRFLLPVAPLALLYIWRGLREGHRLWVGNYGSARRWAALVFGVLTLAALYWIRTEHGYQAAASAVFWLLCAVLCLSFADVPVLPARVVQAGGALLLGTLMAHGTAAQMQAARENLHFSLRQGYYYPDIEAAHWIRTHSASGEVVMARKVSFVYHYSQHPVTWLPPVTDLAMLAAGICKYHVHYVILVQRDQPYFRPSDEQCLRPLLSRFPQAFCVVHSGPRETTFQVNPDLLRGRISVRARTVPLLPRPS